MKRMKKWLALLLASASILALSACSDSGNTPSGGNEPSGDDEIVVGISVATATNNPHIVNVVNSLIDALEAQGWKTDLQDADGDASKQSTQFDTLVTKGVDLIIYWAHDAQAALSDLQEGRRRRDPRHLVFCRLR